MGNWEKPFDTVELSENLKQFSDFLDSETIREQYADSYSYKRLCQAVKYASELLLCFKPELSPFDALEKLQTNIAGLVTISSGGNFALSAANQHIDAILNILPRFVEVKLKNKSTLLATKTEITEYLTTKKAEINTLADKANVALEKIEEAKRDIIDGDEGESSYLNEIKAAYDQAHEYSADLAKIHEEFKEVEERSKEAQSALEKIEKAKRDIIDGDEETDSYLNKIKQANTDIQKAHNEAREFYNRLAGTPAEGSNYKDAVTGWVEKIKQDRAEVADSRKDIDEYYVALFGKEYEEGEHDSGLKFEIEKFRLEMESLFEDYKKKAKASADEIENLLPGATSAGLATAYEERFHSYEGPRKNYTRVFYGSTICLFFLACFPLSWFGVGKTWLEALIWKVPLFVPFIWSAIFSANRANEMTRLMEEYAHKWTLAKSYEGFKKQIFDMGGEKSPLMDKLLDGAISNLAYNASESLNKVKKEKHPYQKILDKLGDITSFLKK